MPSIREFFWNDGGRSSSGFVGSTGDCVTRAIAVATGLAYRNVYEALRERLAGSPREGVPESVYGEYLKELGWIRHDVLFAPPNTMLLVDVYPFPDESLIIACRKPQYRHGHLFTVHQGVLHDTWDPREERVYATEAFWTPSKNATVANNGSLVGTQHPADLTQAQFEKIIARLKAIDSTAKNHASTDGERENALRMMHSLMLRHNLSREDIVGQDDLDGMQFTRMACPLNGSKAYAWESELAFYVSNHIFPMTQWYSQRRGHRTLFFFYGPRSDVQNAIELFRELLLTIATAAKRLYGGYARSSGASYAEGYVANLPRGPVTTQSEAAADATAEWDAVGPVPNSDTQLVQIRTLSVHKAAGEWLQFECGVKLVQSSRAGRNRFDPAAAHVGRVHGAQHKIEIPTAPKRISDKR